MKAIKAFFIYFLTLSFFFVGAFATKTESSSAQLRSFIKFNAPIKEAGVTGLAEFQLKLFTDGSLAVSVKDRVEKLVVDKYLERDQLLRIKEAGPSLIKALDHVEKKLAGRLSKSSNEIIGGGYEHDFIVSLSGRSLVQENASDDLLKNLTPIRVLIVEILEKNSRATIDQGRWIEGESIDPMNVKLSEVIENQAEFDGKRITLDGYLLCGEEEGVVYANREIKVTTPGEPAPFIEIHGLKQLDLDELKPGSMVKAELTGTFYRGFWDSETQFAGRLERYTLRLPKEAKVK